mgnify:CR=1 FL=1
MKQMGVYFRADRAPKARQSLEATVTIMKLSNVHDTTVSETFRAQQCGMSACCLQEFV